MLAQLAHLGSSDAKAAMKIILVDLLESLEYLRNTSVRKMVDRREANLSTQRQEEGNLVDKEDVNRQEYLLV